MPRLIVTTAIAFASWSWLYWTSRRCSIIKISSDR